MLQQNCVKRAAELLDIPQKCRIIAAIIWKMLYDDSAHGSQHIRQHT